VEVKFEGEKLKLSVVLNITSMSSKNYKYNPLRLLSVKYTYLHYERQLHPNTHSLSEEVPTSPLILILILLTFSHFLHWHFFEPVL
jgi:hypothetical protein